MLNSGTRKSTLNLFGMFTISCAKQWTKNFCSTLALARSPKSTQAYPRMIQMPKNCRFLISALVNLAKMEFLLGKLLRKVKQIIVITTIYTSAHISLDDDLVVEFTDDEADEVY